MSDEPIESIPPTPMPHPNADPSPVQPESLPPGRSGFAVDQVALVALVFVATLLLLLGATRLVDRGTPGPTANDAGIVASPSPSPSSSSSQAPGTSSSPRVETETPSGTPLASPTGDPVLVGAGDIGDCGEDGDEATAKLLDGIPGTVFTVGDNAYNNGTAEQFQECYHPNWGRHRERTRPAPGNHDWGRGNLDGYLGYFEAQATGPDGTSWYSYDLGTWHVIVLDSVCSEVGCDAGSPQVEWLEADLAASDARCTVAYWHHPRFSSGRHGNDRAVDVFWQRLYDADVDVVVNGHDHDYERFAPQDPDNAKDSERGIREFVVGTGGTNLRRFEEPKPNSELRVAGVHGVLALTLRDGTYEWEFIATTESDVSDRGTAPCH
jgi:acid phosphatase type 7